MGNELKKQAKAVNKQADKLYKDGMYVEAIKMYVESINLMKEAGEYKIADKYQDELDKTVMRRSEEINKEADALYDEGHYEKAMHVYQQAYELLEKAGEKWFNKKGKHFLKELNKAKEKYAENLQEEAEEMAKNKDWDAAIDHYKEILKVVTEEIDKKMHQGIEKNMKKIYERWADDVNDEGDKLYKDNQYEDAIQKYAKAVQLIDRSDDKRKQKRYKKELAKTFEKHAKEINDIGDKLMKNKQYMEAADLYAQSVQVAEESGNNKLVERFKKEMMGAFEEFAKDINDKGDALYKDEKYKEAAEIYKQSVEAAAESKDEKLIRRFQSEYEKAMEKWADNINDHGDAAMKEKKFDDAFNYYKKSVEIIKETHDARKIKKYTKEFQDACDKLSREINDIGDEAYKNGEYEKAYNMYNKSVKLMEVVGNNRLIKRFSRERNKALSKME